MFTHTFQPLGGANAAVLRVEASLLLIAGPQYLQPAADVTVIQASCAAVCLTENSGVSLHLHQSESPWSRLQVSLWRLPDNQPGTLYVMSE